MMEGPISTFYKTFYLDLDTRKYSWPMKTILVLILKLGWNAFTF